MKPLEINWNDRFIIVTKIICRPITHGRQAFTDHDYGCVTRSFLSCKKTSSFSGLWCNKPLVSDSSSVPRGFVIDECQKYGFPKSKNVC